LRVKGGGGVKPIMPIQAMIQGMVCVMDVKLGVCEVLTLEGKNRASLMNELSTQDKGVRATTTPIDRRVSCFANRSHGQGIVVVEDALVKGRTDRIIASVEVEKITWDGLKFRKRDLALIAAHAKPRIDDRGVGKGFSSPMKGMARRTLNVHFSQAVNLPSRIKRTTCNGEI